MTSASPIDAALDRIDTLAVRPAGLRRLMKVLRRFLFSAVLTPALSGCLSIERNFLPSQMAEFLYFIDVTGEYYATNRAWPESVRDLHAFAVKQNLRFTYRFDSTLDFGKAEDGTPRLLVQRSDGSWWPIASLRPDGGFEPLVIPRSNWESSHFEWTEPPANEAPESRAQQSQAKS